MDDPAAPDEDRDVRDRLARLGEEQEVTGTFKFKKVDLKKQGFDPGAVTDPLYVLLDRGRGYEPLSPEAFGEIMRGGFRF